MLRLQQQRKKSTRSSTRGFSVVEMLIVLIIISIIVVLALPQIISSRRLFRFSTVQREIATHLRESRQLAISERQPITFRYDDVNKRILVYGGTLGAVGDAENRVMEFPGSGLAASDIRYGRPTGVSASALADGTDITSLTSNIVEVTFQADGSVVDVSDNPTNAALFMYHAIYPADTAFAISVLGAGGRAKVWRYSAGVDSYIE